MATKKSTTKATETVKATVAAEVKPEKTEAAVKAAPVEAPAEDKVTEKKAPAKKAAAKKPAARRTAAKKDMKVKTVVEYYGKQVEEKDIIASVKKAWTKSGKKVGDIKTMELYIKPEEAAVYYVINKTETGAVAF